MYKFNDYSGLTTKDYKHTPMMEDGILRDGKSTYETAPMVLELTKISKDIANAQYWDGLLFGIYIPDAYTNLEYLK